ncbi:hypothetical protein Tsubulata_000651 [Turnera subulata]|uniref:Phytocyanin domain-containing protein n=1 Tax=Turnera subulata TaxID=218843 RepID=A0A9Q0J670_9ROSI|nr:hypothetical protein Tsubulata_000651 [Turnera subulata]
MAYRVVSVMLLLVALMAEEAIAVQHIVGGSQGWDESTDFDSWASGQKFKVGDTLVFKYSSLHSVVELGDESSYKKCDLGSKVASMSTGNDVVKLDKPGTRYFACGTMGHCDQGMKVKITTESGSGSSTPSSSSSPSSSSAKSTPAAAASSASAIRKFSSVVLLVGVTSTGLLYMF